MKIRRYIGNTTQEAMYKLRKELGSDAVILHTRKIKQPGFLGFFKRPLIEIVAALDEENNLNDTIKEKNRKNIKKIYDEKSLFRKIDDKPEELTLEIRKLRTLMENVIESVDKSNIEHLPIELNEYKKILTEHGVEERVAVNILKNISNQINTNNKDSENLKDMILTSICEYLGEPQPITINGRQKVIFFVGPTGVGKTTTLAKIAANFALQDKNKVGLITADTYRIAAVEQLKTYSEILDIPLKIIYETKEIYNALSNLADKELILVDTAGKNHKDTEQFKEIKELISSVNNKEIYLVLSATTDWNTIKSVIQQYDTIRDFKIIFTKLDESENLGIILNTKYCLNKPLSYFTTGQNVPEDIEIANINQLSKRLIGEI